MFTLYQIVLLFAYAFTADAGEPVAFEVAPEPPVQEISVDQELDLGLGDIDLEEFPDLEEIDTEEWPIADQTRSLLKLQELISDANHYRRMEARRYIGKAFDRIDEGHFEKAIYYADQALEWFPSISGSAEEMLVARIVKSRSLYHVARKLYESDDGISELATVRLKLEESMQVWPDNENAAALLKTVKQLEQAVLLATQPPMNGRTARFLREQRAMTVFHAALHDYEREHWGQSLLKVDVGLSAIDGLEYLESTHHRLVFLRSLVLHKMVTAPISDDAFDVAWNQLTSWLRYSEARWPQYVILHELERLK